ncbi:28S ribosomal protein S9, mitochondrial [Nymphon striatum]|nr:28S ribosomal protein S9, mitochondrial [Nymphon striatum]
MLHCNNEFEFVQASLDVNFSSHLPDKVILSLKNYELDRCHVTNHLEHKQKKLYEIHLLSIYAFSCRHNKLMDQERNTYELGRRHLANIMGENPETFDERDIKEAISYLLPSSLTHKGARPVMLEPEKIFPKKQGGSFDITGRPHNTFFYTMKPNFFTILHTAVSKLESLNEFETQQISNGQFVPPEDKIINFLGSEWVSKEQLENKLNENFPDFCYKEFIYCFDNLAKHPYSYREKEFLFLYRNTKREANMSLKCSEISCHFGQIRQSDPIMRDDGRLFVEALGERKHAKAVVKVTDKGSGMFSVNNEDIRYFEMLQNREQIMFPLLFTGHLHKVDIECTVNGNGESAQAGAIRHGLSLALSSLVSSEEKERMRIAGLLTRDVRMRERKKPGQKGARAKYPWYCNFIFNLFRCSCS